MRRYMWLLIGLGMGCGPSADASRSAPSPPRWSDAHTFLRANNAEFVASVCNGVGEDVPIVTLHGDLHLEQYAVTSQASGLSDFDDTGTGPVDVDLAHLAVSLRLATMARGWDAYSERLWHEFIESYLQSIRDHDYRVSDSRFDRRIRRQFVPDRGRFLARVDRLCHPVPAQDLDRVRMAFEGGVPKLQAFAQHSDRRYFQVVDIGRHHLGVGSAGRDKLLVRVRGPTERSTDDRVFELKEIQSAGLSCVRRDSNGAGRAASEVLFGGGHHSLGVLSIADRDYWLFEWDPQYHELDIQDPAFTREELSDVLKTIGTQLGRGHRGAPSSASTLAEYVERRSVTLWGRSGELALQISMRWRAESATDP